MLNAAQLLASMGYPVFPCSGKTPRYGCKWKEEATTDPLHLLQLLQGRPGNIGVAVPRGTIVIDLDIKAAVEAQEATVDTPAVKAKPAVNGIQAFSDVMPAGWRHGGPQARTGGGGVHLWFKVPPLLQLGNSSGDLPKGIDVRGLGGYVVVPPSIHPDPPMATYGWIMPMVPIAELPELPGWLIQRILTPKTAPAAPRPLAASFPSDNPVKNSYLDGALNSAVERILSAGKGERNKTLNQEAYDLAGLQARGLDLHHAEERLYTAGTQAGLTAKETRATIRSAFGAGARRSRDVPEGAHEPTTPNTGSGAPPRQETTQDVLSPSAPPVGRERPTIMVTTDERAVNNAAVEALAAMDYPDLYQRAGGLCRIIRQLNRPGGGGVEAKGPKGLALPDGTPSIRPMALATLRERLADSAKWISMDKRSKEWGPAHPPEWSSKAVAARGEYPKVHPLAGIADYPLVRRDGSVSTSPGYDKATAYFLGAGIRGVKVPDKPTAQDAEAAARLLVDVVADFPLNEDIDRAAWLALLLTPLARAITAGPTPLFIVEANVRGTGKTLLANLVGLILTGRDLPAQTYAYSDEELEKILVSVARLGLGVLCFDNVKGTIGGGVLDKWLTSTTPSGRVLGSNELPVFDWQTTMVVTGNNAAVAGDTDRRSIYIKLQTEHERPELRSDFRHPDIRAHVLERRPQLLGAALTILKAHALGGWAEQGGRPKGSFEHWAQMVRDAVILAGLPDCERAPDDPSRPLDADTEVLGALLAGLWESFHTAQFTVGEALEYAFPSAREAWSEHIQLRDSLSAIAYKGERPTRQRVGKRFAAYKNRWINNMCLTSERDLKRKINLWRLISRESAGSGGESAGSVGVPHREVSNGTECHKGQSLEGEGPTTRLLPALPAKADQGTITF